MKSPDAVPSALINAQERFLWFEEVEERRMSASVKFMRTLSRLNPLYSFMLFFQKPVPALARGFARNITAVYLVFGLLVMPVTPLFASDSILPPLSPTGSSTPVIAVTSTSTPTATQTAPTVQGQPFSADQFVMTGALSAATTTTQNGRSLYVSTTGNNTGDGSTASPYGTIQYAVSQLQAGDTLHIAEGTYNVTAGGTFVNSGTADNHIKVVGDGNVVLDGTNLYAYTAIFNTGGQSYLDFENLTVKNSRAAVQVTGNSSNVTIDNLKTDKNQMAVIIDLGSYITVKNSIFANSRNAVVANNTSHHLTFENIEAYGSQDIYAGYETAYRNGDGFIMNLGTHDVVFRNIITHDNWDAGIDTKAVNTLIDNVISYSNKNNFKIWADTVIQNSMSYGARILTDDPVSGEGNGLNARTGNIKIINSTFFDNANHDIQVDAQGPASNVSVENSIFYRNINSGKMIDLVGGNFSEKNNIFYWVGKSSSPEFTLNSTSKWLEPQFVNSNAADLPALTNTAPNSRTNQLVKPKIDLHLKSTSPAINTGNNSLSQGSLDLAGLTRIVNSVVDLGAYEYQNIQTDVTAPVISAVASSNVTTSGAVINWTTNEVSDSQVQYRMQGTTAWLNTALNASLATSHSVTLAGLNASAVYEYQVKSKDQTGNLAIAATMSNFKCAPLTTTCTTVFCGVTNAQTVSGTIKVQPNLTLNPDVRKVSYYLNGTSSTKEYASPFIWGGTGFDTTKLADGTYTLSGAYTTKAGDQNFSITFIVKNIGTADITAPVISGVASSGVTVSGATINWTTNESSDSQVQYRVQGTTTWLNTTLNASLVTSHSVILAGLNAGTVYEYQVKSKDQAGNPAIAAAVSNFTTMPLTTVCTTAMCGVTSGQTVGGTVFFQPSTALAPSIKKVAYYLNGTLYERNYASPFTMGGTAGLDTKKLANGSYTISGAYTTASGDVSFTVTFTVKN